MQFLWFSVSCSSSGPLFHCIPLLPDFYQIPVVFCFIKFLCFPVSSYSLASLLHRIPLLPGFIKFLWFSVLSNFSASRFHRIPLLPCFIAFLCFPISLFYSMVCILFKHFIFSLLYTCLMKNMLEEQFVSLNSNE